MVRYWTVPSAACAGTPISETMLRTFSSRTTVSTNAMPANSVMTLPMVLAARSSLFAPIARPMVTVAPMARPTMTTVSMYSTWLPFATAVMPSTPMNWPAMNRSAIPYSVCRKYDNRYGNAKTMMVLRTLPVVRFFSMACQSPSYSDLRLPPGTVNPTIVVEPTRRYAMSSIRETNRLSSLRRWAEYGKAPFPKLRERG